MLLINSYFKILDGILVVSCEVIPPTVLINKFADPCHHKCVCPGNATPFVLQGIHPSIKLIIPIKTLISIYKRFSTSITDDI